MEPLDVQLYRFTIMFLSGIISGLFFDLYRVFRWITRPKGLIVYLQDFIFWIVITIWVVFVLFWGNWVELRLYVVIGMGLGMALYLYMASAYVLILLRRVAIVVKALIGFVSGLFHKLIIAPSRFIFNLLFSPIKLGCHHFIVVSKCFSDKLFPPKTPPNEK